MRIASLLMALGLVTLASSEPVRAQSMNVPVIVDQTLTQVCIPWLETGDRGAAVRAATALRYRVMDRTTGTLADPDNPPSRIMADGSASHRGTIILTESTDRVCAIDISEAGAGRISILAAAHLAGLGMTRALDRSDQGVEVVVWAAEGRQAVIGPSVISTGATLTLNWLRSE